MQEGFDNKYPQEQKTAGDVAQEMSTKPDGLAFELFRNEGYQGSFDDFKSLMESNDDARKIAYELFQEEGYEGTLEQFEDLTELKKKSIFEESTIKSHEEIASEYGSHPGLLERSDFDDEEGGLNPLISAVGFLGDRAGFVSVLEAGVTTGSIQSELSQQIFPLLTNKDTFSEEQIQRLISLNKELRLAPQSKSRKKFDKNYYEALSDVNKKIADNPYGDLELIKSNFEEGKFSEAQKAAYEEYKRTGELNEELLPRREVTFLDDLGAFFEATSKGGMPSAMTEIALSSLVSMFTNPAAISAGAATGGAAALAASPTGIGSGIAGTAGFFSGASALLDSTLRFNEYLNETLQEQGLEPTKENYKKIIEDDDLIQSLQTKALKGGLTVGAIDGITTLLGASVAAKTAAKGMKVAGRFKRAATVASGGALGTIIDASGGALGEAAAQTVTGEERNTRAIIDEFFAEVPSAFGTSTWAAGSEVRKSYKIKGKEVTKDTFTNTLQVLDDSDLANADLSTNDSKLSKQISERKKRQGVRENLDPSIPSEKVERIVDKELEIQKLDGKNSVTAKMKVSDLRNDIKDIINETKEKKRADETKQPAKGNRLFSEPLQDATTVAERFAERTGRTFETPEPISEINQEKAKSIGKAYDEMKSDPSDPEVQAAYNAMIDETIEQYKDILESGYEVEINDNEPYKSSTEMIEDLRDNKRMKIFSTESGFGGEGISDSDRASNPLLKDSGFTDKNGKKLLMNDVFRFVHDYFGHSKLGNSFGPIGEENAWRVHSAMYSPLARRAMTSETRGQNSWVNFSGVNDEAFKLRDEAREIRKKAEQLPEDSPERKKMLTDAFEKVQQVYEKMRFADQKIGLLPDEMVELTEEEVTSIAKPEPASKERVQSIIDNIIKKTEARLTPDVDPKKKLSNVLSYLQENSKLYEELNDSQREKMVIDLTKKLEIPVESSPQIRTVLGIKKEAPVTIKVKPFEEFKKRLRELEKVSKEAVKFTKKQQAERKKAIVDLVKELRKKGRLSSAQQQVILNRVTSAVIDEKNFDNVMSYVKKVYDNAELAEKLRSIVALQKRSFGKRKKKNIQTKLGVAPQLYPQVEKIATMDIRNLNLDKVDDMLDVLSVLGERKAVLDLAKLKDMSGKIENILSDENVAPEVTPQQAQAIERDNEFMREEFNSITEEEFDSLPEKLKKNIGRTRRNVAAGFMSPDAIDVIKEVNATRSSKVVLEKINPNKFLDAIAFSNRLRTFLNKSNNLYLSKIRSNSTRYIDDVLGNVKGYEIYKNTFEPLSKAYGKLQGDLEVFSAKKQEAIKLIAGKNLTKKANEVTKSSVKMKLTALQFEFEFNENDKSTAKATDWIDATIEHMKEKDFSEHEVRFYEGIKEEFLSDQNVSAEQLYSKLSENEKKAYKIMQDANSELVGKMLFTSAAVRGERPKTYNSYTYHDVLYSDNEYKGIVENKFQTLISQKPSTKAGTIIDRQPGVRAINLDIFSSSENGARQTLTDYHMTMPVRTLYSAIAKMKKAEGITLKKKKAVSAISKAVDESLRNVFERDHARSSAIEQAADFFAKVGYRAALGSLPRAASELLSNMEYVMMRNPKDFTKGMQSLKQMTSVDGLELFKSLGSVHTARLFGAQDQVSAFSGKTAFNRLDKNPSRVKGEIYNKAEFIVNAINNVSDTTSYMNDTLIQSGDKAISKPLWFGSFINKFQELTGVTPDLQKLAENDSDYFKKYSKEIKDSTFYADENVNAAATSLNPFDSILKLQQKQGGDVMSVAKRIYVMADAFMARFTINEYMQARRAIHSLVYDGKMTKKQAAATLAGTTARMSTYMLLYGLLRDQMRELFGIEPEEDDKMDLLKRQIVGSVLGLMARGTSGNMPMIFINYGLERANEEYMESLRSYEDYDPYKHSIVFSQVTKDEIERGDFLKIGMDVLSGPYTYPVNVGLKTLDSYARMKGSARISTKEKYKEKLKYVHSIELLGMLNVLPFYKDIRDIAIRKFMQEYPYRGKR